VELPPNILLVIADDVGVDQIGAYGFEGAARTPTIDGLAATGVRFDRVWSNPVCSSTRATILTGRYGFRTGVGFVARQGEDLSPREVTLAQLLSRHPRTPYGTAAFGKWHLTAGRARGTRGDVLAAPVVAGFSFYRGVFKNIVESYTNWREVLVRETAPGAVEVDWRDNHDYNTTAVVDHTAEWIRRFETEQPGRPWFVWLAFNAAHSPYHEPPARLHERNLDAAGLTCRNPPPYDRPEELRPCYQAMIEAMDHELGRLLERELSPLSRERTQVIFIGDNGSVNGVWNERRTVGRAKGTTYEGGIRVPLIVSGAGTGGDQPRVDEGLVNTTDLFATILEVAGLDLAREIPAVLPSVPVAGDGRGEPLWVDSLSLLSALRPHASAPGGGRREYAYAELFKRGPPDPRFPMSKAIRDRAGYKLIRFTDPGPGLGREEFYYLPDDPLEQRNLLGLDLTEELATRHAELRERLDGIARSGWRATGAPLPPIGPRSAGAHGS